MRPIRLLAIVAALAAFDVSAERREFVYSVNAEIDAAGVVVAADVVDEISAEFEVTLHSARVEGGKFATNQLGKSAMSAVKGWRFQPERIDGIAVATRLLVPVKFTLSEDTSRLEIAPPEAPQAGKQLDSRSTKAVAIENAMGLELISDSAKI